MTHQTPPLATTATRPPRPETGTDHYEVGPPYTPAEWSILRDDGHHCSGHRCPNPPVVRRTTTVNRWFPNRLQYTVRHHYCAEHLAGRSMWVEDGEIRAWRWVPPT